MGEHPSLVVMLLCENHCVFIFYIRRYNHVHSLLVPFGGLVDTQNFFNDHQKYDKIFFFSVIRKII